MGSKTVRVFFPNYNYILDCFPPTLPRTPLLRAAELSVPTEPHPTSPKIKI